MRRRGLRLLTATRKFDSIRRLLRSPWFSGLTSLGALALAGGCMSTQPAVPSDRVSESLALSGAKVAVLPFSSAPGHPDTGQSAREISMGLLVKSYRVSLISPSKVEAYCRHESIRPTEHDRQQLEAAAKALGAEVLIWGSVNTFTPYRSDLPSPATPPYVDITLYGLRSGGTGVARVTGHKQGETPDPVWGRPLTFEALAQSLIADLLLRMR
jgi:hypothetical protein